MNLIGPNLRPDNSGQAPDEIDALLRKFFQSEMPRTWKAPVVDRSATDSSAAVSWWSQSRSRLALAASIALLMLASWWIAGRTTDYATPIHGLGTTAGDASTQERNRIQHGVKETEIDKAKNTNSTDGRR